MGTVSDRDIEKFYKTLELPVNSSQAEVKAAYRSLARKYHPDRFTGDPVNLKACEERFKTINAAYEFLKIHKPAAPKAAPKGYRDSVHIQFPSNPTNFPTKVHRKGTQADQSPSGYFYEARRLKALGDLEEAIMALDNAISLKDDYYLAYELRSEIYLALGNDFGYRLDLRRGKHFRWKQTGKDRPPVTSKSSKEKYRSPSPQKPPAVKVTVETKPPEPRPPQSKPLQKQAKDLQTFVGHVDTISQILFVNGSLISASHDGSVRIWNVETGALQGYLMVGAEVTAIATSPNSNLFITGDRSGKVKMWNLVDYKLIRSLPLHTGKITGIHFTQNGKGFVTTGEDGILKIFQLNPASLRHTLQISNVPIFCSALMGDRIFTASADSQLRMIVQGNITHTEPLSSPLSKTMAVNTDRKWIAIGDDRGSVHCFDAQGNLHKSFVGCPGRIQSVNFLSSGKKLLVLGETPLIKIWDTTTWNLWTEWKAVGTGQLTTAKVQGNQVAIAQGNSLQLWQLP
jgi:COMPASS component SWD3